MDSNEQIQPVAAERGISPVIVGILAFVFIGVSVFLALSYELFIYRGYQTLYKQKVIGNLGREASIIFSLKETEVRKMELLEALGKDYANDPGIAEVWITDKDFRLIYSSDSDNNRMYKFQKLPAQYFGVYQQGFSLNGNQYQPAVRNDLDRRYTFIALAIRTIKGVTFDHTVGIKIKKMNFLMKSFPVTLPGKTVIDVPAMAIMGLLLLLIICFTALTTFFSIYNKGLVRQNLMTMTSAFCKMAETGDMSVVKDLSLEQRYADLRDAVLDAVQSVQSKKEHEVREKDESELKDKELGFRKTFTETILKKPELQMKGMAYALNYSNAVARLKNNVLIKELTPFSYGFLVTHQPEADAQQGMIAASTIQTAFQCFNKDSTLEGLLSDINHSLVSSNIPSVQAIAGQCNLADGSLRLVFAGYRMMIHYNARIREAQAFIAPGLAMGKAVSNDFLVSLRSEKLNPAPDDALVFFNPDIVEHGVSVDTLKKLVADNHRMTAENLLPSVMNAAAIAPDLFCFVLKKT